MAQSLVRAIYRSVRIPGLTAPNDTAHLKVHYPAMFTDSESERNTGLVPALADGAAFPIIILLPGINVGPEGLSWLACALNARGFAVVTYALIGEELAGYISLTPGIDLSSLAPDKSGVKPSSLALAPIIADLVACNAEGVLAGRLDLTRIVLGGHSAGGTMALLNANPDWYPGVCAAFAYGAHTAAATMLGTAPGMMNIICDQTPVLILGGSEDNVIAQSAARYGDTPGDATGRVVATFEQAITRDKGDCVLAIIKGANHFSILEPKDMTTGRGFLDGKETALDARILIENLIWAFLSSVLRLADADAAWQQVDARKDDLSVFARK